MAEQRTTPCLDNSRQAWLPGCPSHLVIPHVMVPSYMDILIIIVMNDVSVYCVLFTMGCIILMYVCMYVL